MGVANRQFQHLRERAPSPLAQHLRLRPEYVFKADSVADGSDLRAPSIEDLPPASALVSPRGSAFRLHLIALAEAQLRVRGGKHPGNSRPIRPTATEAGWTDLLGSWAATNNGRVLVKSEDKRLRQIQAALDTLEGRRLVELPNKDKGAGKYEGFLLLDETVSRMPDEDPIPYTSPLSSARTVDLPMAFVTNGWVHLLEDSELSVLLMVACGYGTVDPEAVAIPSDMRVNNYGIHRARFESHRWLQKFGLIDVWEINRRADGKALDYEKEGALLNRLVLRRDGFQSDAGSTITAAIDKRLSM